MPVLRLKPIQERAALLLAEGWKQVDVARELHVDPATVRRWMREERFMERVAELCTDLTAQAIDLLRESVLDNTEIILRIAKDGGESGIVSSQLKAALWAVEKVLGSPAKADSKLRRARQSAEAELLRMSDEEMGELLERGVASEHS